LAYSEVGAGLTAIGVLFLLLGVLFLFDGPLLAMGDVRLCVLRGIGLGFA
jgi:hypothetical protein